MSRPIATCARRRLPFSLSHDRYPEIAAYPLHRGEKKTTAGSSSWLRIKKSFVQGFVVHGNWIACLCNCWVVIDENLVIGPDNLASPPTALAHPFGYGDDGCSRGPRVLASRASCPTTTAHIPGQPSGFLIPRSQVRSLPGTSTAQRWSGIRSLSQAGCAERAALAKRCGPGCGPRHRSRPACRATSNPAERTSAVRPRGVSHTYAGRSGRGGHESADGSPTRSPTETDDVRGHHRR
jgi:hypothetical protein